MEKKLKISFLIPLYLISIITFSFFILAFIEFLFVAYFILISSLYLIIFLMHALGFLSFRQIVNLFSDVWVGTGFSFLILIIVLTFLPFFLPFIELIKEALIIFVPFCLYSIFFSKYISASFVDFGTINNLIEPSSDISISRTCLHKRLIIYFLIISSLFFFLYFWFRPSITFLLSRKI